MKEFILTSNSPFIKVKSAKWMNSCQLSELFLLIFSDSTSNQHVCPLCGVSRFSGFRLMNFHIFWFLSSSMIANWPKNNRLWKWVVSDPDFCASNKCRDSLKYWFGSMTLHSNFFWNNVNPWIDYCIGIEIKIQRQIIYVSCYKLSVQHNAYHEGDLFLLSESPNHRM